MLTATEKEEDLLKMADTAALMDWLGEEKRSLEVLNEAMNSVYYLCDADFSGPEELDEARTRETLAE